MNNEWQSWIERLKNNDLTEAELIEFRKAVESDPGKRDAYLSELLAEVSLETAGLPSPFLSVSTPVEEPAPGKILHGRWQRRAAIAACIAALATASYFTGRNTGARQPARGVTAAPLIFATITDADGLDGDRALRIGQPLQKQTINLPEGAEIGIAMRGGARLKLRGPAEMAIQGPDKVRLTKGRISTYAPPYANGFTVDTDDGTIVDLGTRFVTAAGTGTGTEIHVLEGLVDAYLPEEVATNHSLRQNDAAILKDGKIAPTEFLAQRLAVPLDPVLQDQDGDGFPDVVETHYGTDVTKADSKPAPLRIEETFSNYHPSPVQGVPLAMLGSATDGIWVGGGSFQAEGLSYSKNGKALKTSGGSLRTDGHSQVGANFKPNPAELSPDGVTYVSFILRNGEQPPVRDCFSGLLLYQIDREEMFVGKIGPENSFGSRLKLSDSHDAFNIPLDTETHLFVIRIDRTRLVTDVFFDPEPGQPESAATYQYRYQAVPDMDRIELRSGCKEGIFPADLDEVRVGLTWEAVVPLAE